MLLTLLPVAIIPSPLLVAVAVVVAIAIKKIGGDETFPSTFGILVLLIVVNDGFFVFVFSLVIFFFVVV